MFHSSLDLGWAQHPIKFHHHNFPFRLPSFSFKRSLISSSLHRTTFALKIRTKHDTTEAFHSDEFSSALSSADRNNDGCVVAVDDDKGINSLRQWARVVVVPPLRHIIIIISPQAQLFFGLEQQNK